MKPSAIPDKSLLRILSDLRRCVRQTSLSRRSLLVPSALAFGASLFEGATIAFLIAFLRGLLHQDFLSLRELPVLRQVTAVFPDLLPSTAMGSVFFLSSAIFCAATGRLTLQYFSALLVKVGVRGFASDLRKLIYARYLSFGKLYFDNCNRSYLQQILTFYVHNIAIGLEALQVALYAAFTLIVYLVLMTMISWQLTLVALVLFPVLHMALQRLITRIKLSSERYTNAFELLSKKLSNTLAGMSLVKASNAEAFEVERFSRASEDLQASELRRDRRVLLVAPVQEFILLTFLLVLVSVIALLGARGVVADVSPYVVFLFMLRRAGTHFGVFNRLRAALAGASGPAQEVTALFDDGDKYLVPDGTREFERLEGSIEVRDLHFAYPGGIPALRGVGITFERGKVTALVGRSGAGKSTLLQLFARFYDPPPGTILVDGVDLRDLTIASWRRRIAYVGQEAALFDGTLRENLVYGLDSAVTPEILDEALERANLSAVVGGLPQGLDSEVGDLGVRLSWGEKQRVSIARAMLEDAEILLLDEATSALDSKTERAVRDALDNLVRGRTTIVIAHRLWTIQHADKVVVLEDGRVVETGSPDDLVGSGGKFFEYCEEQRFDVR